MAGQRSSFGKLQRDRDKKAKAAAKRSRRQDGTEESVATEEEPAPARHGHQLSTPELLERIAEVHQQFDAGTISYELFEETKADLMSRLAVD